MEPPKDSAEIVLQDRDLALLRGLFESRVMTAAHVASLYFDGREEMTKKRLQKLKAADLVAERPRDRFEPAVLLLGKQGLALLRERGVLREYPKLDLSALESRARVSPLTLRHELEVMDAKTSLAAAVAKAAGLSLAEFTTWPRLNEFESLPREYGQGIKVKPDGFIRITEEKPGDDPFVYSFFFELDRSTETQDALVSRAVGYLDFYKSGGFAERNGATREAFQKYPFRVLFVLKSAERRNNAAERLLVGNPPILTFVWLTTIAEITADPLGPIWVRPADFREATRNTPFDVKPRADGGAYRRQAARESHVDEKIRKMKLLEE